MHVISDIKNYQIVISSLSVFGKLVGNLIGCLAGKEKEILDLIFSHLTSINRPLKEIASKTLIKYCLATSLHMAEQPGNIYFQDLILKIRIWLMKLIKDEQDPSLLIACLQAFGAMSRATNVFCGEKLIHDSLGFLIENSEISLFEKLDRFENFDFEKNPQNFKAILFNQKQLIGYFKSLAFIISETTNLTNLEVKYAQRIIDLATRYLSNFFPPYLASLYDGFSGFLDSFPIINYNKLIFRNFVLSILNSMDRCTVPFQLDHQILFFRFFEAVVTTRIVIDRQTIIIEVFLNTMHEICSQLECKFIDCENYLSICDNKITRDFFNVTFLFLKLLKESKTQRLLDSLESKICDIFFFIESRFKSNPCNFVYLRILSGILTLPSILHSNKIDKIRASIDELLIIIENQKEKYKNQLVMCIYEFCFRCVKVSHSDLIFNAFCKNILIFLQGNASTNSLVAEALTSMKYLLEFSGETNCFKKPFLVAIMKELFRIIGNDYAIRFDACAGSSIIEIYNYIQLDSKLEDSNQIFIQIINIIKNCHEEFFFEKENGSEEGIISEDSREFEITLQTKGVYFSIPLKNIFFNLAILLINKTNLFSISESIRYCRFLVIKIFENFLSIEKFEAGHHKALNRIMKVCLQLLSKSFKESDYATDEILELTHLVCSILFLDEANQISHLNDFCEISKNLYISDLEMSNFNNKMFLESVNTILGDFLSKSIGNSNHQTLDSILDFLRMSHRKQNEFFRLFQSSLLLILLKNFQNSDLDSVILNKMFEVIFEILLSIRTDKETNFKVLRKIYSNLLGISNAYCIMVNKTSDFKLLHSSEYYNKVFTDIFQMGVSRIEVEKMTVLNSLLKIETLKLKIRQYFDHLESGLNFDEKALTPVAIYRSLFSQERLSIEKLKEIINYSKSSNPASNIFQLERLVNYLIGIIELQRHDLMGGFLEDKKLFLQIFFGLFDIQLVDDSTKFHRALEFILNHFSQDSSILLALADSFFSSHSIAQLMETIDSTSIGPFKETLSRIKTFFRLAKIEIKLPEIWVLKIHAFICTSLKTRDELSIDIQKCKILLKFMSFFKEKIKYNTIANDKDQCLHQTLCKIIGKSEDQKSQITHLIEELFEKKRNFREFCALLKVYQAYGTIENLGISVDLTRFGDTQEMEDLFFNDFLEFLTIASSMGIQFSKKSLDFIFCKSNGHLISGRLNLFSFFKLADSVSNFDSMIANFVIENFNVICQNLFSEVPTNIHTILSSSSEFSKFTDLVVNVVNLVLNSKELGLLKLIYFLFSNQNSKFIPFFSEHIKKFELKSELDDPMTRFINDFMDEILAKYHNLQGSIDNEYQIFENFHRKLIEKSSNISVYSIIQRNLESWVLVLSQKICDKPQINDIIDEHLFLDRIIIKILEIGFSKLERDQILNLLAWDSKFETNNSHTKNDPFNNMVTLCRSLIDSLEEISKTETVRKIKVNNLLWEESFSRKEAFIKLLAQDAYNLIIVITLKIKRNTEQIIQTILINESNKPKKLLFESVFSQKEIFNFQVLTNFKYLQLPLTKYAHEGELIDQSKDGLMENINDHFQIDPIQSTHSFTNTQTPCNTSTLESEYYIHSSPKTRKNNTCNYQKLFGNLKSKQVEEKDQSFGSEVRNPPQSQNMLKKSISSQFIGFIGPFDISMCIEMDVVNSNPMMPRFIDLFLVLKSKMDESSLSRLIASILVQADLSLNARVFFLKLILNFKEYFRSYSILKYLSLSENGGKGLHYFYRDLCHLFIEWNQEKPEFVVTPENVEICEKVLKMLMIKIGDPSKKVFENNLLIFKKLLGIFRNQVKIDFEILLKFLSFDQKTHIWQIAGVTILKILIDLKYQVFPQASRDIVYKPTESYIKFEKALISLSLINSKILLKVLGELFAKLEKAKIMYSNFMCSNGDSFGVKLLENFPRISRKLLILLAEISYNNSSFYLKQQCFRMTLLDVFKNCNKGFMIHALQIFLNSMFCTDLAFVPQIDFLITDLFNLLPTILSVNSNYLISLSINILIRILKFNNERYFTLIYNNVLTICGITQKFKNQSLELDVSVLLKFLGQYVIENQLQDHILASVFTLSIKFTPNFQDFFKNMTDIRFFDRVPDLQLFLSLVRGLGSVRDIAHAITSFVICLLRKTNGNIEQRITNLPTINKDFLEKHGNLIDFQNSNSRLSKKLSSFETQMKEKPPSGIPRFEVQHLKFADAIQTVIINKKDDVDEEMHDEEPQDNLASMDSFENGMNIQNELLICRFSKATNEMMPNILLKKYNTGKFNNNQAKAQSLTNLGTKDFDLLAILWCHIRLSDHILLQYFNIFMFDVFKNYRNQQKVEFLDFIVFLFMKSENEALDKTIVLKSLSELFFTFLKSGKFQNSTNEILLAKLNSCSQSQLILFLNEEYLLQVEKQRQFRIAVKESYLVTRFNLEAIRDSGDTLIDWGRKKIKGAQESTLPRWLPNVKLIDNIFLNYIKKAAAARDQPLFCSLTKVILPKQQALLELSYDENFSEILHILNRTNDDGRDELVSNLLLNQKQECFKKMQKWDEIISLIATKEKNYITIDENDLLSVSQFSKIDHGLQQEFIRSITNDKKYCKQFGDVIKNICTSKSEKNNFENEFPHNISVYWFSKQDFNRARYFNELHKEKIQRECKNMKSNIDPNLIFQINNSIIVNDAIEFTGSGLAIEDPQSVSKIGQILTFKKKYFDYLDGDLAFDRFSDLQILIDNLVRNFKYYDCTVLEQTKIVNQIRFCNFLITKKNDEKVNSIINNLESSVLLDNDYLLYEFTKCYSRIKLASIFVKGIGVETIASSKLLWENLAQIKTPVFRTKLKAVILNHEVESMNFSNSHDHFNKLTSLVIDLNQCLLSDYEGSILNPILKTSKAGLQENFQSINMKSVHKTITKVSKLILKVHLSNKTFDIENFTIVLSCFLENIQQLFKMTGNQTFEYRIPFIFKIIKRFPMWCQNIFVEFIGKLNPVIFLKWIPQIIGFGDSSIEFAHLFTPVLEKLIKIHPETVSGHLFYKKNVEWLQGIIQMTSHVLRPYFGFFDSLQCFKDPEILLNDILKLILEQISQNNTDFKNYCFEIQRFLVNAQTLAAESPMYKEFLDRLEVDLTRLINELPFKSRTESFDIANKLHVYLEKVISTRYDTQSKDLSYFSLELVKFSMTYHCQNPIFYMFNSKNSREIRLIDLKLSVAMMQSKMRPKKLTFICSDNKNRSVLLKYGDDLQEDYRIMTIFNIFNSLIKRSTYYDNPDFQLWTYEILPIDKRFGLIECIQESKCLKLLIEEEIKEKIEETVAMRQRTKFVNVSNKSQSEKHLDLFFLDQKQVIEEFDREVGLFTSGSLKQAILKKSNSPQDFIEKRRMFLGNYALCCLAGYLLGIGDRHLENLLIIDESRVSLIDFGCTFDMGIHLGVPELVPFRLTPVITTLGFPFEIDGVFAMTMRHSLSVFNKNSDCLNDYIEIYLHDPIEKWRDYDRGLDTGQIGKQANHELFIARKVAQFNQKINFKDPRTIYLNELRLSNHYGKPYFEGIESIIKTSCNDVLEIELECSGVVSKLVEMATNKNLLGRMWSGWRPFV